MVSEKFEPQKWLHSNCACQIREKCIFHVIVSGLCEFRSSNRMNEWHSIYGDEPEMVWYWISKLELNWPQNEFTSGRLVQVYCIVVQGHFHWSDGEKPQSISINKSKLHPSNHTTNPLGPAFAEQSDFVYQMFVLLFSLPHNVKVIRGRHRFEYFDQQSHTFWPHNTYLPRCLTPFFTPNFYRQFSQPDEKKKNEFHFCSFKIVFEFFHRIFSVIFFLHTSFQIEYFAFVARS